MNVLAAIADTRMHVKVARSLFVAFVTFRLPKARTSQAPFYPAVEGTRLVGRGGG